MGRKFKFAKTELQYSGQNAKPKYMVIEFLPEQVGTLTYTGEELFPTWKNLDPLKVQIEGEVSATNAGKHYITVTPTGIFAWPDMTQTPKQIEYIIDRAVIDKVPTQKGTLTFNNTQQSPEWNDFDASKMVIGGVYQNQTHKGTYIATFTPDSNHCWADKTFDAKEVSWAIQVLTLTKPALQTNSFPYTGSAITPTITNFNANFMSKSGDTSATNKGNYTITIGLLYADDTCWTGGSTANFNLTWAITKVTLPKVTANNLTLQYNGSSQEPEWKNFDATYIEKIGDGANVNAGSYTTTFAIKDAYKANVEWQGGGTADISFNWKVEKIKLAKVTAPTLTFTYNKQNQYPAWQNYDENYIYIVWGSDGAKTDVGSYKTTFALVDTTNTSWSDGTTANLELTWKIDKLKLAKVTVSSVEITYTGAAIQPAWQNYNTEYIWINGDGAQVNVKWSDGAWRNPETAAIQNYSTEFNLGDRNNTCWTDGTTSSLLFTWKIVPQKATLPTFKSASIGDTDGVTVTASNFNNVETSKGIYLEEEKTYYEAKSDTVRFIADNGNYTFYYNNAYKLYYDLTITITDARFPFTWTDTNGRTQTANNQTEFESKFPVVNTSSNTLTTIFTADGILLAEKFGQSNLQSGEVSLESSSGSTKTYRAISTATSSRPASMGIHIRKSNGSHLRGNVHLYR